MNVKRLAVLAIGAALGLSGCTYEISDVAAARDECHELGGVFDSWKHEFGYSWECDFSDDGPPDE